VICKRKALRKRNERVINLKRLYLELGNNGWTEGADYDSERMKQKNLKQKKVGRKSGR
jgi:hypothetical protein